MKIDIPLFLLLSLPFFNVSAQDDTAYLRANAVRIDNPEKLSDSVYTLLSSFQIIMLGEMHGTNESAPFVSGLTNLFVSKGDSVQVGLEISPALMTKFISQHTDSSIYQSDFFSNPPFLDGRESVPWANLISSLNKNPKVNIFFFDVNDRESKPYERDSLMSAGIKLQFNQHPKWKMVTLSGNYHNRLTNATSMASFLKRNLAAKICSLNMEYQEGACHADFGHGLEIKQLGSYPSVYNSTAGYDRYLLLVSPKSYYEYTGLYYIKYISAAKMTSTK